VSDPPVSFWIVLVLVAMTLHVALDPHLTRPGARHADIDGGESLVDSVPLGPPDIGPGVDYSGPPRGHVPRTLGESPIRESRGPYGHRESREPPPDASLATVRSQPRDQTPYGIETIYGNPALANTTGGEGVDVAVLDTGVAMDHPDLRRRIDRCRDYTVEPVEHGSCADDNGHGTHVAGTVLADGGPDGNGIYGVAPDADLFAFKVCTADRNCSSTKVRTAVRDAADAGAEVIVLSLGGRRGQHVQSAIQYAHEEGVLVVAAAGNDGPALDTLRYPAADRLVVAVGAVERIRATETIEPENYRVPEFSSRGRDDRTFERADGYLEVAAPGVGVLSTWPGGYRVRSGTSVAAPHVAGLAAKLWPLTSDRDDDGHRHEDVRRVLQRRAPDFDVTAGEHARDGYDPAAGLGLPQVRPPGARFTWRPAVPTEEQTVRFSGADSTAPDGTIVRYEWDFDGDDTTDARGQAVSHTFGTVGTHPVSLRVTDDDGAFDATTREILVNDRPTVSYTGPSEVPADTPVTLTATVTDEIGSTTVTWWFPDGTSANGTTVTHTFEPGRHVVSVVAEDEYGARTTREVALAVRDTPGPTTTPPGKTTQSPGTDDRTRTVTARPGPGFGGVAVFVSAILALFVALLRSSNRN